MDEPKRLRVEIKIHKNVLLKVTWQEEVSWPAYFIDRSQVKLISQDIRKSLTELVVDAKDNKGRLGARLLREVAQNGNRLHQALFRAVEGRDHAKDVEDELAGRSGSDRITFHNEDLIHVPWGLVYDGSANVLPTDGPVRDVGSYVDFWCLKHWVTTTYIRVEPRGLSTPSAVHAFRLLPVLNKSVFERVLMHLSEPELRVLKALKGFQQPIYSSDNFFDDWAKHGEDVGLLYFYCHADGTRLSLGSDDLIPVERLGEELARKARGPARPVCLVFLNGCATAVGADAGGFLEATGGRGLCGFIGTETRVPDLFAKRFALAFFHQFFIKGKPIYEALDTLRRKHWPLGLLYGVYCYPLLRVIPDAESVMDDCFDSNLCTVDLGTEELG
jgi:hypothetical protein